MPANYLGDTPIFQATMSERERNEFENFKRKVTTMPKIEQPTIANFETIANEKETIMPKEDTMPETTKTTKTIANEKENATMTETTTKKSAYTLKKDAANELRTKYLDEILKAVPAEGVTSCLPGKTIANLTDDPKEQEILAKAATFFDMGNTFCTESQAKKFGGTLNEEETGFLVNWKPKATKDGRTNVWSCIVYPVTAFEWENGEPTFDEDAELKRKARRAQRAAKKAAAALKEANDAAGIKPATKRRATSKAKATAAPAIAAAPAAKLLHIKLPNGIEFDAHDAAEVKELMALFA